MCCRRSVSISPVITRFQAARLIVGGVAFGTLARNAQAQSTTTVRVAITPVESATEAFYAIEMGFFAKAGLDVDIQLLANNPSVASAVASGAVDIGHAAVDTVAAIHSKGIPVVVIAPAAEYLSPFSLRTAGLAVRADSAIRQAKDLNGKIVGVASLHGFTDTAARIYIDRNGGDIASLKFVEVPFPLMATALESGRVDAVSVAEPFMAAVERIGRFLSYGFDDIGKHFLMAAWFGTPQWIRSHPEVATRFAVAIRQAAMWANRNPEKAAPILAKVTKLSLETVAGMARARYAERLTPELMQPLINAAAKYAGFQSFPGQELVVNPTLK